MQHINDISSRRIFTTAPVFCISSHLAAPSYVDATHCHRPITLALHPSHRKLVFPSQDHIQQAFNDTDIEFISHFNLRKHSFFIAPYSHHLHNSSAVSNNPNTRSRTSSHDVCTSMQIPCRRTCLSSRLILSLPCSSTSHV